MKNQEKALGKGMTKDGRSNAAIIVIGSAPANAERRKGAWSKEKACSKGMAKDGECGASDRLAAECLQRKKR